MRRSAALTEGLYSQGTIGIADSLEQLLTQHGLKNVQTRPSLLEFPYGTSIGQYFAEDLRLGFSTLMPFMRKWSKLPDNYEELYQAMLDGAQKPGFLGPDYCLGHNHGKSTL